jgi:hypothetical protein
LRDPDPEPAGRRQLHAPNGTVVPAAPKAPSAAAAADYRRGGQAAAARRPDPGGRRQSAAQAYANYIRRLQAGMSGFTCYASLQMPR